MVGIGSTMPSRLVRDGPGPWLPSERRMATSTPLLEQPGHPSVGQLLAAGLAGRAVLQGRVGEGDLGDGVAAHGTGLALAPVHPHARLLLALEVLGRQSL